MESFAVAHSGSLSHVHTVNFSSSAVDIAREARLIVTIVVAGWITVTVARGLLRSGQDIVRASKQERLRGESRYRIT